MLIRDVPDEMLTAIDARAAKLGISRVEYVRRRLAHDAGAAPISVSVDHLRHLADRFTDLADPDVMVEAWD